MRNKGFTLAEVLITLTIVGVVAAITVPALYSNVNNATMEKQTVKFYTQLQQAVSRFMVDERLEKIVFWKDFNPEEFVNKYIIVNKACTKDNVKDCLIDTEYSHADGSKAYKYSRYFTLDKTGRTYIMADGAVFSVNSYGDVYVDVNGKKGPNKEGYDLWWLSIQRDGTVTEPNPNYQASKEDLLKHCKKDLYDCFAYFKLNNYKIDY